MVMDDYKREYITEQFKKSFGKKYENYCVSRIYHLLQREDVQIVTQQVLQRNNQEQERAMADLYFPQINVWVEVDEGHHAAQKEEDKKRTEEVINCKIKHLEEVVTITTLEEPERIEISNKSISEINRCIDEIVDMIKKKIKEKEANKTFVPWNGVIEDASVFIDKGYIEVADNAQFKTSQEVSKLFNKGYKPGSRILYFSTNESNAYVWCPKLSLNDGDFEKLKCKNTISADGNVIMEFHKTNNEDFWAKAIKNPHCPEKRFVFPQYKCSDGRLAYKFRGVFQLDIEETEKRKVRIWRKIKDRLELGSFLIKSTNETGKITSNS